MIKLEHRIGVPASSREIWDVLSDLGRWHEWNSVYPEVHGLLRIAQKLTITEHFPGMTRRTITPVVVDWVPGEQIIWSFKEASGLVKRVRYIEIEPLNEDDTSCILSNGEIWDGLMGPSIAKQRKRLLRNGFEQLNLDIVQRLEQVKAGTATADGDRG